MSLVDEIRKIAFKENKLFLPYFIPDDAPGIPTVEFEETYVQITLEQMFLKHRRELYKTKYPLLHALVRFAGIEGSLEVGRLIRPSIPGLNDTKYLDRVMTINQNLFGPALYRGGDVELLVGFFAAPANDWAKGFFDLAQEISSVILKGPLTIGISLVKPVKESIEYLFGKNQLVLKMGINAPLRPSDWLKPGHLAIIYKPVKSLSVEDLSVRNSALYSAVGPYDEHDFILLKIDIDKHRSDWQQLGELGRLWRNILKTAAKAESQEEVKEAYQQFIGAVYSSDVSWSDRGAIMAMAQQRIKETRNARETGFFKGVRFDPNRITKLDAVMKVSPQEIRRAAPKERSSVSEALKTDWIGS